MTDTPTPAPTDTPWPTPLPPSPTPTSAAQRSDQCEISAWVSDENPSPREHVYVYGKLVCDGRPVAGAPMYVEWNYKTTLKSCEGITNASGVAVCERSIGRATPGYFVRLDVTISYNGQDYHTSTGFTPRGD